MRRVLLAAALLSAALAPTGVEAQIKPNSPREDVENRQLAYNAAKEQYQSDSADVQLILHEWDQLREELGAARERGEDKEVRRLSGLLQELTGEKTQKEFASQESRKLWIDKGKELIDTLNDYLNILSKQIQSSPVGSDDDASNLYNDYEARLEQMESEVPEGPLEFEPLPNVQFRDEDGPREQRHKLSLLENGVKQFADLLSELDREIESLTDRLIRDRRHKDRAADRDRFDDNRIPTGGDRSDVSGDAGASDSTAVTLVLEPLEVRIAKKKEFRTQVAEYLDGLRKRVEDFKRLMGVR